MFATVQSSIDQVPVLSKPNMENTQNEVVETVEIVGIESIPDQGIPPGDIPLEDPVPEVKAEPEAKPSPAPIPFSIFPNHHTTVEKTTIVTNTTNAIPGQVVEFEDTNSTTSQPSTTSSVTYYSSAGGGGGGGGSSHRDDDDENDEPEPEPEPDPVPDDDPPKTGGLHGVNFIDPVLNRKEDSRQLAVQTEFVDKFVGTASKSHFNLFRVPVTWEAYVGNEANFLAELDYLVDAANEEKISVWIDFHHFYTTSQWGSKIARGEGFPSTVVACYKPTKPYERDPEVRAFWDDYYLNKVRDQNNGCERTLDVWTMQADFMKVMIEEIDHYPNVLGYELLNEPHVWKDDHYEQLGNLHTELAQELRKVTDKTLIFTRETPHGFDGSERYKRRPGLEYLILPKDPDKNLIYAPHLYALKDIEKQVKSWKDYQKKWESMGYEVDIAVGEWATQRPQLPDDPVTQENMDGFVKVWSREGYMHTYWAYGASAVGEGNALATKNGDLKKAGILFEKSIVKHYDALLE